MAKYFNPADVVSVKTKYNLVPTPAAFDQLEFLVRRSARRMRREARAL